MISDQLGDFAALLRIRLKFRRRDMLISGGLFIMALLGFILVGILAEPTKNSVYITAGIVVGLGLSFIMTWVRVQATQDNLDLIENLQRILGKEARRL